jgi:pyrimidine-nucleoside phosphorylase
MLLLGGVAVDRSDAERHVRQAIASGGALARFQSIVESQGGDPRVVDDYGRLPAASGQHPVAAARSGYVTGLDAELIGRASVALGAGRDRVGDAVDPAAVAYGANLHRLREIKTQWDPDNVFRQNVNILPK